MFNRVKFAIANAVGGLDSPQTTIQTSQTNSLAPKFPYGRPHFLKLNVQEEVPLSADHRVRPIIVPRERDALPWYSGYAECVNAGKSSKNEDQATVYQFILPLPAEEHAINIDPNLAIHVTYFGMFDGHAGYGAAVSASKQLHLIIEEKLLVAAPILWATYLGLPVRPLQKHVNFDLLIVGLLEKAFWQMDELIAEDRDKYLAAGGCTAIVSLFILGKVFIANAGDSRVVHCFESGGRICGVPISYDFTPETEKPRLRLLAERRPELLHGEFSWKEYQRPINIQDLGKQIIYKEPSMIGWATKTLTKEDLKMSVVSGEGKRSRLLNTIGVTRGFGDHDLKAINTRIPIKPFLSSQPEVSIIELSDRELQTDEVIIMGTDGLWDVTSNKKSAVIVDKILKQFRMEKHKYISAAQALVANARGKPFGESFWKTSDGKMATADDVSCFVIPLAPHGFLHKDFLKKVGIEEIDLITDSENVITNVLMNINQVSIADD